MYGSLVEQIDVFRRAIVTRQQLNEILLNDGGLFDNACIRIGDVACKETRPLRIGKGVVVQPFQLMPQVGYQLRFCVYRQIVVCLFFQQRDKRSFEFGFRLIFPLGTVFGLIVADDRTFGIFSYKVVSCHFLFD